MDFKTNFDSGVFLEGNFFESESQYDTNKLRISKIIIKTIP